MLFPTSYVMKPPIGAQSILGHPLTPTAGWLFNEGSGLKVFDIIGRSHGTFGAGATAPTWKSGYLIEFDGIDDFIGLNDSPVLNITSSISISVWAKLDVLSKDHRFASKHLGSSGEYGWTLGTNNSNYLYFGTSSNGSTWAEIIGGTLLTTDTWYHIVAVFNDNTNKIHIYLNGNEDATSVPQTALHNSSQNIRFGIDPWHKIDGTIREIEIFNCALLPNEIKQLYINPYCWVAQPMEAELFYAAPPIGLSIPVAMHHYEMLRA